MTNVIDKPRPDGGDEDGDGLDNVHESDASIVQDHVQVGSTANSVVSVPCRLHTLLVRRPGRVSAAMTFVDTMLKCRSYGAAGSGDLVKDEDGNVMGGGEPTKEFLGARAAAFRTLEAYFSGSINDELMVQAEFMVDGQPQTVRFAGQIDGETGRTTDPRYAPKDVPTGPPVVKVQLSDGSSAILPPGMRPDQIKAIYGDKDMPNLVKAALKSGNSIVFDRRTGTIVP